MSAPVLSVPLHQVVSEQVINDRVVTFTFPVYTLTPIGSREDSARRLSERTYSDLRAMAEAAAAAFMDDELFGELLNPHPKGGSVIRIASRTSYLQALEYMWPNRAADPTKMNILQETWYLDLLKAHPDYQGQVVGKALVLWGVNKAKEENVCASVLSADGKELSYERYGFFEVGRANVGPLPANGIKGGAVMFCEGHVLQVTRNQQPPRLLSKRGLAMAKKMMCLMEGYACTKWSVTAQAAFLVGGWHEFFVEHFILVGTCHMVEYQASVPFIYLGQFQIHGN
ncbi:Acyl-CoA N-acyltransferase [Metarhizium rileyi]|uniref:Acyl-CoA N-acyltransferase n=1 Tax=Metarhizium rileyi (strain RCEF 4871) TaxID=1649241 RepID=A0A166Y2A5_METRR|nr:Acyl-CoA N-acyltransferase [Metarhizium rileyi RCEF 4871]